MINEFFSHFIIMLKERQAIESQLYIFQKGKKVGKTLLFKGFSHYPFISQREWLSDFQFLTIMK